MYKAALTLLFVVAVAHVRFVNSQSSPTSPASESPLVSETTIAPTTVSTKEVSPTVEPSTPAKGTTAAAETTSAKETTAITHMTGSTGATCAPCNCPYEPHFDTASFFGGMLLAAGLVLIGYLIWYFAYGRKHRHEYAHFH